MLHFEKELIYCIILCQVSLNRNFLFIYKYVNLAANIAISWSSAMPELVSYL